MKSKKQAKAKEKSWKKWSEEYGKIAHDVMKNWPEWKKIGGGFYL